MGIVVFNKIYVSQNLTLSTCKFSSTLDFVLLKKFRVVLILFLFLSIF